MIDHTQEIIQLTEQYGGVWALNHTRRLLHLIEEIGQGLAYDSDALWLAAHLHDWGAYPPWAIQGVEHYDRSAEVADSFLAERGYSQELRALVNECIRLHHAEGTDRSLESILLRDADALDFLGAIGILRNVAIHYRDLQKGIAQIRQRQARVSTLITLESAQQMAAQRIQEMDEFLARFEAETWGCY